MSGAQLYLEPTWQPPPGVRALCTLRSAGSFGPGEAQQRAQRVQAMGLPGVPVWLRQVHGIAVADLDAPGDFALPPVADAAVTVRPGVVCAIQTADCLPVLLAAADGSAVAAAHAGWRGLAAGVIEATLAGLRARIPAPVPLVAWLGPAISAAHFEVGEEVRRAFLAVDPQDAMAFVPNERGRWQCDLYQLARNRLARAGIGEVAGGEHCTWAEVARFYSHRRDTCGGHGRTTGRMATLIWRDGS
ncbi:MAG: peptidoglycan editing factor PgeF [Steroidobacteraceae bacterium]